MADAAPAGLVRDRAFAQLRGAIIAGALAPGMRLVERELCASLGISRASVREIIRRLEAERLVSVAPHRGPTVISLTAKQAREIYEVRGLVESLLIRRFTEIATAADAEALRAIFAEVEIAAAKEDVPAIVQLMLRFNGHLLAVVDHQIAADVLGELNARINWLRVRAMARPGRIAESLREYRAILRAVADRHAARAAAAMLASSRNARDAALAQLAEQEPASL